MADGGLARLRFPGGRLTAAEARAVARAAETLGSGEIDLTNRANLQIRGLARDAGPALAASLEAEGFRFHGEADRRLNVMTDPFSGLDPLEIRDMRPCAEALADAIAAAPWISGLSPKFSFVLDGGGATAIGAAPSDVLARATPLGLEIDAGPVAAIAGCERDAVAALMALARAAGNAGPAARIRDLDPNAIAFAFEGAGLAPRAPSHERSAAMAPRLGAVATTTPGVVALALPVPVGRLDARMLAFLADLADREGDGRLVLAPWSAVVVTGVAERRAASIAAASEEAGFTPLAIAERLSVSACAGAPACERAREPAKALGASVLRLAAREPWRLPAGRTSLHFSACPKGCAGSAPADVLLLGASDRQGWRLSRNAAPRAPGAEVGRLESASAAEAIAALALKG